MKTIRNQTTGVIERVKDNVASERVKGKSQASSLSGGWKYCSKEEWKKEVRDV